MVSENNSRRIATGMLNDVLIEAMAMNQPPAERVNSLEFTI